MGLLWNLCGKALDESFRITGGGNNLGGGSAVRFVARFYRCAGNR